jgi:dTDP-glucose pyrophosphorylase
MRHLHIIMPMAGEGSRFLKEGYNTPKPLIEFNGKTLFERAIGSVHALNVPFKYSFIVRAEHIRNYQIDERIKAVYPTATIFSVEKTTRGAVETCMLAENAIEADDAILILDCDLEFTSTEFMKGIESILSAPASQVDGGRIVSFHSDSPKYSYAEIDANKIVLRTAEKEPISNHALVGAYFFSKAAGFLKAANALLSTPDFTKPEFYVSLLYNQLIANGETVKLAETDTYFSYGTPEELEMNRTAAPKGDVNTAPKSPKGDLKSGLQDNKH